MSIARPSFRSAFRSAFRDISSSPGELNSLDSTFFASFKDGIYRTDGGKDFSDMFTLTRASTGTYVGSDGTIKTATTNTPRFDYSTGKRGLLVEEASTNQILDSEDMTVYSQSPGSSLTVTGNQTTAPDGNTTADSVVPTTDTNNHLLFRIHSGGAVNTPYTFSVFAKANGYDYVLLQLANTAYPANGYAIFNLANGTISETGAGADISHIQDYGSGWYRCSVTVTSDADGGNYVASMQPRPTGSYTATFAGDGTSGVYLWGTQVEQKQFPTSYIPTAGTTVTRAADVLTVTPAQMTGSILTSGGAMPSAVSFAIDGVMSYADNDNNGEVILTGWSDGTNYIFQRINTTTTNTGMLATWQLLSTVFDFVNSAGDAYSPGVNVPYSIASRWATGSMNGATQGTASTENTTTTGIPDLSTTSLKICQIYNGVIYNFQAWDSALDDTTLEQVTS